MPTTRDEPPHDGRLADLATRSSGAAQPRHGGGRAAATPRQYAMRHR